ncbi:S-adenosylmethionine decarboxylase [Candidatus Woesearchaeota archaeon]|nr:S-adenosylmethionine decarboxylase [Candidatus Woesearchaeota archaeon]
MHYNSKGLGNSIQFVCYGVDPVWIHDNSRLMSLVRRALLEERYTIISEASHKFESDDGPTGYTGVFVISESDATFHTYEENSSIEITVNTCRGPNAGWVTVATLVEELEPQEGVYAVSTNVPIERSKRVAARESNSIIEVETPEEFLQVIDDRVRDCYKEMYERFGDSPDGSA